MGNSGRPKISLVSVIIVSYNAEKFIKKCLESVFASRYGNFEVIVVENGIESQKLKFKRQKCNLKLKIIKNKTNLGSCEARNQGAEKAKGNYLIFFDCDTEVDPNCISEYVAAFERDKTIGAMHGKLLKTDKRNFFDSTGEYFDSFGILNDRAGYVKDIGQFNEIVPIASGKAASYAIRRDLFGKIGGYDKDFFFFLEEPDLDMRVWLMGKRVVFLPKAVCYHAYGTKFKDHKNYYSRYLVRYYGPRNYILMLLKNFSWGRLLRILPFHLMAVFSLAFLFLLRGKFKDGFYILKGIFWNLFNVRIVLKKRAWVQKMRVVDDFDLDFLFEKRPVRVYFEKAKSYVGSKLK
jgi:GT2 family glycosyltransferase